MSILNVEIKAKSEKNEYIRNLLKSLNAYFKGEDHQIDTYFKTNRGRLKMREGNIENNLIYYERDNTKGPKNADITLFKSHPDSTLKELLTKSNGILTMVDKKREIYFIENVKFHLDRVNDLGTFLEIEAIDKNRTIGKEKLLKQCHHYMDLFKISESDLISVSYSDLILEKQSRS